MRHLALSTIGRDRPGIVAAVTGVLLDHGVNIEDSRSTILRGQFSMVLILAVPEGVDAGRLHADLVERARDLGVEAVWLSEMSDFEPAPDPVPSHVVTVYGADHPGIVHAVSTALAARAASITDLATRLVGEEGEPLYAMMMEVAVPAGVEADQLAEDLAAVGREQGLEVSVRPLERDAL